MSTMSNVRTKQFRPFVGAGLALLLAVGCGDPEAGDDSIGAMHQSLLNPNSPPVTSLLSAPGCSGTLVPTSPTSTSTRWALGAQHGSCINDEGGRGYDSSDSWLRLQNGQSIRAERIYVHPLANWGLAGPNLGAGDPVGKVDVALWYLSQPATIANPDDLKFAFASQNVSSYVFQESHRCDGTWSWCWDSGIAQPHDTWANRAYTDIETEGGDSGGPLWGLFEYYLSETRLLVGLHTGGSGFTHAASFREWVEDAIECGPYDISEPDWDFCSTSCPCNVGEGDCDSDSECVTGLECIHDAADKVGLPSGMDVCLEPTRQASNTSGYCESIGGCQLYEGDCNSHDGCKGDLVCKSNIGAAVGLNENVDVCDLPRIPEGVSFNMNMNGERSNESGWCTSEKPCGLGGGDCNSDSGCRGYLVCKQNVGNQFGFTNNSVDVCVHPSYL